jgi:hypothetical protein
MNVNIGISRPRSFSNRIVQGPSRVRNKSAKLSRSFSCVNTPQVIAGMKR